MNRDIAFRIERLNREINKLEGDFRNCDNYVKEIDRRRAIKQSVVTRFSSKPEENREKLNTAERELETLKRDYDTANRDWYRIQAIIAQKKNELSLLESESSRMDLQTSFRR